MLELRRQLHDRLRRMSVEIRVPDVHTLVLARVPTNSSHFSQPQTNVLIKRPREGLPFLVCVDEQLEYTGTDEALARLFAANIKQSGWRAIMPGRIRSGDLDEVVEMTLDALGAEGCDPEVSSAQATPKPNDEPTFIESLGTDLSASPAPLSVGRDSETHEVVSCLLRWGQARLPLVVGPSGVGKTNLMHAVARKLGESHPEMRVVAIDLAHLFAGTLFPGERDNLLTKLFSEAAESPDIVLALEHIELAVFEAAHGSSLLTSWLDRGARLLGSTLPEHLTHFGVEALARRVHPVELQEPSLAETLAILEALREPLAEHHGVDIDSAAVAVTVRVAADLAGHFPAKAIALLDAAAARASLSGLDVVGPDDVCVAADGGHADG